MREIADQELGLANAHAELVVDQSGRLTLVQAAQVESSQPYLLNEVARSVTSTISSPYFIAMNPYRLSAWAADTSRERSQPTGASEQPAYLLG
jgi:hypothetical protein